MEGEISMTNWLCPDGRPTADVYVVGFQEVVDLNTMNVVVDGSLSNERAIYWQGKIFEILQSCGDSYDLVAEKHMVGILIVIYCKKQILSHITDIRSSSVGIGIMGIMGNKGGVAIRFRLYDTSLCFICAHLRPQKDAVSGRNLDAKNIFDKIVLPPLERNVVGKIQGGACRFWAFTDIDAQLSVGNHDLVFWLGDLNYRIDRSSIQEVMAKASSPEWAELLDNDQLNMERNKGNVFVGFHESDLTFPPTYKYQPGTNTYECRGDKKLRAPAWCDRILWRVHPDLNDGPAVRPLVYARSELLTSDHKPVYALFEVDLLAADLERERDAYQDLINKIDKWENAVAPRVVIEERVVDFGIIKPQVNSTL